jgi:glycosyltransferase involved in cell wall biosynthesis
MSERASLDPPITANAPRLGAAHSEREAAGAVRVKPGKSILLINQGLTGGGAELAMLRLAKHFVAADHPTRIAVLRKKGVLLDQLPAGVAVDEIGGGKVSCIFRLARYLRRHRTDAVIGFMTYTNVVAILAQLLSLSFRRIVVTEHNAYSKSIRIRGGVVKLFYLAVPVVYRWAKAVICVSHGVADDLAASARLPLRLLPTVYNPVITDEVLAQSWEEPDHPWLRDHPRPVLLAAGRLERQKDYPTLFKALALLRPRLDCSLIVLGEGERRAELEAEIARLGLADRIDLAGFRANAIAFMRRADLFVLSSAWEGFSLVLVEAMAAGCPVVSTDAPHGPREVLQEGRWGRLVPVGDATALAEAIERTLRSAGDPAPRQAWAKTFTVEACAARYLEIAGLAGSPSARDTAPRA